MAAIGYNAQLGVSTLNVRLGQTAVQLRDLCQVIAGLQDVIASLGLSGLQGLGYSSADAADLQNKMSIMNTVAQVYYGHATQADPYDFNNALTELRGIM